MIMIATSRLPLLAPSGLSTQQKELYESILKVATPKLQGFPTQLGDGALIGLFNAMLHFPMFGAPAWAFNKALIENSELAKPVHQLVILVTGARFGARYEIYAHEILAEEAGPRSPQSWPASVPRTSVARNLVLMTWRTR
jgi:4-carboxymuconolactone decarboxylase